MGQENAGEELLPEPTLLDVISDLRRDAAELEYPLECIGARDARTSRERLLSQLDDHLIPRLRELSAPAVVVIAGSTGAGKSTLLNSLLGAEVSSASVIRPTTREPVLVFNPADADLMAASAVLDAVRIVKHERVPRGLAILDAPDLDSLLTSNRETAARLLEAADLWLFVTTAARYGDALPWQALERAKERGASVALVLNRVSKRTLSPVRSDLLARLKEHNMAGVPLFVIDDAGPHEGLLDPHLVAPVARWLKTLAGADHARTIILRTLRGAIAALRPWISQLREAVETQIEAATVLKEAITASVPTGLTELEAALTAGDFAAGIIESRWNQLLAADPGISKLTGSRWRKGSRRAGERRNDVLGGFVTDIRRVTAAQLETAFEANATALKNALTAPEAPDGGPELFAEVSPDRFSVRADAVQNTVRSWTAHAKGTLDELALADNTRTMFANAIRGLGETGLLALVLVATTGVVSAQRILSGLLGPMGAELIEELRTDLLTRVRVALVDEATPYAERLTDHALRSDAAVGLALRQAELKRVV